MLQKSRQPERWAVRHVAEGIPKKHNCARIDVPPSLPSPTALLFDASFYLQASLLYYTYSFFFFYQRRKCDSRERRWRSYFLFGWEKKKKKQHVIVISTTVFQYRRLSWCRSYAVVISIFFFLIFIKTAFLRYIQIYTKKKKKNVQTRAWTMTSRVRPPRSFGLNLRYIFKICFKLSL